MALTKLDRCDSCGAEAMFLFASDTDSELLFCTHHTNKFTNALVDQGFSVKEVKELVDA